MTIIITQINKYGMVFGADSNITNDKDEIKPEKSKKVFEIKKLNSAMAVAGTYTVDGIYMDEFLEEFIVGNNFESLDDFVDILKYNLDDKMTYEEKAEKCIMHIGGYDKGYPRFFHISNVDVLDSGKYNVRDFTSDMDFNENYIKNKGFKEKFEKDQFYYQLYTNGFLGARVVSNYFVRGLTNFIHLISEKDPSFRLPNSLPDYKVICEVGLNIVCEMMKLSNHGNIVGGEPQFIAIPYDYNNWKI
jgi:hypothetical protein